MYPDCKRRPTLTHVKQASLLRWPLFTCREVPDDEFDAVPPIYNASMLSEAKKFAQGRKSAKWLFPAELPTPPLPLHPGPQNVTVFEDGAF